MMLGVGRFARLSSGQSATFFGVGISRGDHHFLSVADTFRTISLRIDQRGWIMTKTTGILLALIVLAFATAGTATAGSSCGSKNKGDKGDKGDTALIIMPAQPLA
jgi:hypothetical protein